MKDLFGEPVFEGLSVKEAAEAAGVSTATIRNWLKTGYLAWLRKGLVDKESLDSFLSDVAGREKLTRRANKSRKDTHDHAGLSALVAERIGDTGGQALGTRYESSLSGSYRNREGIYYTPGEIVSDMLRGIPVRKDTTFLDPCCGSGNFIMGALQLCIRPENIHGFDTDPNAIAITRKRILEETGCEAGPVNENIRPCNFLEEARILEKEAVQFDLIFTNPPWGKKLKLKEKEALTRVFGAGRSMDTSSLFFFAALQLLSPGGSLWFLVQEALFNISTFGDTRRRMLGGRITRIIDYGRPFRGLLSKAQAFILGGDLESPVTVSCETADGPHLREKSSFASNPGQIINFWLRSEEARCIERIYSLPHTTLEGRARWALGIVTGNNARYCRSDRPEGYVPVYRGSDITPGGLAPAGNFIPGDFSLYQQVAPLSMYQAEEKLIYRFISSDLVFFHDREQRYILNSANLLIPDKDPGLPMGEICALFNSGVMNWLFRSLFNTHKVLRGDLEQLPLHLEYFRDHGTFREESYLAYLGLEKTGDGSFRLLGQAQ